LRKEVELVLISARCGLLFTALALGRAVPAKPTAAPAPADAARAGQGSLAAKPDGAPARQNGSAAKLGDDRIILDVVVVTKSGAPVSGLAQQDFTVLDNKVAQTMDSFRAVDGRQEPIETVLVIDAVNTPFQTVAYEREEIDKFLRDEGGHLAHPMTLAIFTDTGTKIQEGFSSDGNALSTSLDQLVIGLRDIRRSAGFYGAAERFELSLKTLRDLIAHAATRPGRKIILWVSPGWPLLSGPNVQMSGNEQQQLFSDIVSLSTQLRQAGVTLYSVDPRGAGAAGFSTFYWEDFVKGVSKADRTLPGDLALQVFATQSGGVAFQPSNDIAALLRQCVADTATYYEVSFSPASGDQPREYHHIEIHVAKPGVTARTRQGYYARP
jgi:VWFA-related protein